MLCINKRYKDVTDSACLGALSRSLWVLKSGGAWGTDLLRLWLTGEQQLSNMPESQSVNCFKGCVLYQLKVWDCLSAGSKSQNPYLWDASQMIRTWLNDFGSLLFSNERTCQIEDPGFRLQVWHYSRNQDVLAKRTIWDLFSLRKFPAFPQLRRMILKKMFFLPVFDGTSVCVSSSQRWLWEV